MFSLLRNSQPAATELLSSKLFDQTTFYAAFTNDLKRCHKQVIIESPFVTTSRINKLFPTLQMLRRRGIEIIINTRDPKEHDAPWNMQASEALNQLQHIGVHILYTGGHHRKLAIIDGFTLWEGSLNILSHNESCEIMRRTQSRELANQMIIFTKLDRFLN